MNLYVFNVLGNCYAIILIATHHMIKFTIITGRKYFSNYVAQSNYLIIQTKLLTALFKNNIEAKDYSKFVETLKLFLLTRKIVLEYSKTVC